MPTDKGRDRATIRHSPSRIPAPALKIKLCEIVHERKNLFFEMELQYIPG